MRWLTCLSLAGLAVLTGCGRQTLLDMMLLRPSTTLTDTPEDWGYDYQEYDVPIAPNRSIVVWHVPSEQSKGLVVVIPGCTNNKSWYLRALPVLAPNGYDSMFLDYEGFGDSPGVPSLSNTVDDALAVVAFAQTLHPKVFVFGASLGTPLAARAAAQYDVAGLILEGSLILDEEPGYWLANNNLGLPLFVDVGNWFTGRQMPEAYDILKYVSIAPQPKLIVHSVDDTIVPFPSGLEVYNAAVPPKTLWTEHFDHGKMIKMGTDVYTHAITGWLDAIAMDNDNSKNNN